MTQQQNAIPTEVFTAKTSSMPNAPDAVRVVRVLWRRKWHVLACAFFIGLAAFVWAARQPQLFTAETTVLLDPRKNNIVLSSDQIVADLEFTNATVESEVARIASVPAIREVVTALGVTRLATLDPGMTRSAGLVGLVDQLKRAISPPPTSQMSAVPSDQRVINRVVQRIAAGTTAVREGNSFVLKLSVTTTDPKLSAEIANHLTELYLAHQIEERQEIARQATRWHEAQLAARRDVLAKTEKRVEELRREQLGETGATSEVMALQLSELARALAEARADVSAAKSRLATLTSDIAVRGARRVAETQDTPPFLSLFEREETLQAQAQHLAAKFGESHDERKANAAELHRLESRILAALYSLMRMRETEISVAQARQDALQEDVETLQARIVENAAKTVRLRRHVIEADAAKESYEQLVTRLAEVKAQADLQIPDARILSLAAIPTGPSAPRPKLMGFFGASIGASIGLFSVLAFEALGRGIATPEELEQLAKGSPISLLPRDQLSTAEDILPRFEDQTFVPIAERLRQLQAVLRCSGDQSRVTLVTSSLPKEGRSMVAFALAQISAQTGKKTLLLRSQSSAQHNDANDNAEQYLMRDKHIKGLIFDCLELPPAFAKGSDIAVEDRVCEWRAKYDAVFIDGPALLAQSDGVRLARLVDETLYVVAFLTTPKRSVSTGLSLLQSVGVRPAALILNKSDTRLDPDMHVARL